MPRTKLKPLKGKKKFDLLFKESRRFKVKQNLAFVRFEPDSLQAGNNADRIIFFAVSISKKTAKKAVIRNRVKRLLRESLRQLLKENEKLFDTIGALVLVWRIAPPQPGLIGLKDIKPDVEELLNKANLDLQRKRK